MKKLFERRWRNDHQGCAWCDRPAMNFEIDLKGEKVGACRTHVDKLIPMRHDRQGTLDAEGYRRDVRIDRCMRKRK